MAQQPGVAWDVSEIGDLSGKVALVTGATSGIGLGAAKVLAAHGATVVLAGRNVAKAQEAAAAMQSVDAAFHADVLSLDLASLAAVRCAADDFKSRYQRLDLLINNAGVMVPPYGTTTDGFELQFGTNHLGHFALTGLLFDVVTATSGSRVVTVSSGAHRQGRINFEDLQSTTRYRAVAAYSQSKLANLLFTYELQRRFIAGGFDALSVAAHPGWARTELQRHAATNWWWRAAAWVEPMFSQTADEGAWPTLRAATDPAVKGGDYYGPSGFMEGKGKAVRVESSERSHDVAVQKRLWTLSEQLSGVTYPAVAEM